MNHPEISIIIPAYNASATIQQCLKSLLTLPLDREIIITDDGSSDNTCALANSFACMHPFIKIIHTEHNGVSNARNSALNIAKGKIIAFVDSDDTIKPDEFMKLFQSFANSDCDMAYGGVIITENQKYTGIRQPPPFMHSKTYSGTDAFNLLQTYTRFTPLVFAYLWKREFINAHRLRFKHQMAEDDLFTTTAMILAKQVMFTPYVHYIYNRHHDSLTGSNQESLFRLKNHLAVANDLWNFAICRELDSITKGWIYCKILYFTWDSLKTARILGLKVILEYSRYSQMTNVIKTSTYHPIKYSGLLFAKRIDNLSSEGIVVWI